MPQNEWSGVLFYKVQGSIKDPANMVCTLVDILLMDKGSHTATDFSYDNDVFKHMAKNDLEDCFAGLVHSHCSFSTFFSGTDISELEDNVENYNFYLSFITNNNNDYIAKLCFVAKNEQTFDVVYQARDEKGALYDFTKEEKVVTQDKMFVFDCEIIPEFPVVKVSEDFMKRTEEIMKKATVIPTHYQYSYGKPVGTTTTNTNTNNTYYSRSAYDSNWDMDDNEYLHNLSKKVIEEKVKVNTTRYYPSSQIEEEEDNYDIILNSIDEFTVSLLSWSEKGLYFNNLDDLITHYNSFNVKGAELASKVLDNLLPCYRTYYPDFNTNEELIFVVNSVVENLEDCLVAPLVTGTRSLLKPVIDSLNNFLTNFESNGVK